MVTIKIRHHKATKTYYCNDCRRYRIGIGDYYLRLFGMAHLYEKPYEIKICRKCINESDSPEIQEYVKEHPILKGDKMNGGTDGIEEAKRKDSGVTDNSEKEPKQYGEVPVIPFQQEQCEICEICGVESCGKLEGRELCKMHYYERHKEIHVAFHRELDIMIADFMQTTTTPNDFKLPSKTTLLEFMEWAAQQSENPIQVNPPHKEQVNYIGVKVPKEQICDGCGVVSQDNVRYGHCWNCRRCPPEHTREHLMGES